MFRLPLPALLSLLLVTFSFWVVARDKPESSKSADALRVLIVDGQDAPHDWKRTTPLTAKTLKSAGFKVAIATTPPKGSPASAWKSFKPDFTSYDVVVMNYYGEEWPDQTYASFEKFVRQGGGLVGIHAGTSPFAKRPTFGDLTGIAWRGPKHGKAVYFNNEGQLKTVAKGEGRGSGHGRIIPFNVRLNKRHPITEKLSTSWSHRPDELYHNLRGPAKNMTVLASAKSKETGRYEPLVWTVEVDKGRSFMNALGHTVASREEPEFRKLLILGTLWASGASDREVAEMGNKLAFRYPPQGLVKKHLAPEARPLDQLAAVKLPMAKGVNIHNPTAVACAPDGKVYVANYSGAIYTLVDSNKDGLEDTAQSFADLADLPLPPKPDFKNIKNQEIEPFPYRYPTGLTFKDGWLYVATTQAILRYRDQNGDGRADHHEVFATGWPYSKHYFDWTFGLRFDKEGYLYTILCTDYINGDKAKDPKGLRGSILKISPNGKSYERIAYGLRFAYDLAFNDKGDLFFTDNKSGDNPTEELNHVVFGGNYGHKPKDLPSMTSPALKPLLNLRNGYSPCGIEQAPPEQPFGGYEGDMFISAWGPDGRWDRGNLLRVELNRQKDGTYKATEHLSIDNLPKIVDLAFNPVNHNLYVARFGKEGRYHKPVDAAEEGDIYRIIPAWWIEPKKQSSPQRNPLLLSIGGDPVLGKEVFKQRACATCHTVDGSDTMLGPDLKSAGWALGREGIVRSVEDPHDNIKTDYDTHQVTLHDGHTFLGILREVSDMESTYMAPGNLVSTVKNADIASDTILPTSLMPPKLFSGLSDKDIDNLVAYLRSQDMPDRTLRLNCGGQETKEQDEDDFVWLADRAYKKGTFGYVKGEKLVNAKFKFRTSWVHRQSRTANDRFAYKFDVVPGSYEVSLFFFDLEHTGKENKRAFSVSAEGLDILTKLDVEAKRRLDTDKDPAHFLRETFTVTVKDGTLDLEFSSIGKGNPFINGIIIRPIRE